MNRQKVLGAIAFPTFMLAWAAAAMLLLLQLQPVAAVERWVPAWEEDTADGSWRGDETALAVPPGLDDPHAMREALTDLARLSEVMNGSWQPRREAPSATVAGLATVVVEQPVPVPTTAPKVKVRVSAADPAAAVGPVVRKQASTSARPRLRLEKAQARVALVAGRFAEAYARLRPAVADARGDSEYLGLLALAAMRTGKHGEAMVLYQHLVALEPDTPRWRVGFALAQESLGLDASGVYRDALALSDSGNAVRSLLREKLNDGGPAGFT